jgi:hypothetical protein
MQDLETKLTLLHKRIESNFSSISEIVLETVDYSHLQKIKNSSELIKMHTSDIILCCNCIKDLKFQ